MFLTPTYSLCAVVRTMNTSPIYKNTVFFLTTTFYATNRVWKLLDKLKQEYKDNNILLVTHGGTIRAINGYFNGTNEKGIIDNPGLKNCEIKLYEC